MKPLARKTAPLDGDLPAETKGASWVTPKLVAEVSYAEFTGEGRIRHGAFHGLREDKEAEEVSARAEAESDAGRRADRRACASPSASARSSRRRG